MKLRALLLAAIFVVVGGTARASCVASNAVPFFPNPTGSVFGAQAPTWSQYFGGKVDATNGVLCNPTINGSTINGPLVNSAATPLLLSLGGGLSLNYNTSTFTLTGSPATNLDIAAGGVTNSMLANTGWTLNGQAMALGGGPYTITAAAASITPGTTTILSGTPNGIFYDNAGVLGNSSTLPSVVQGNILSGGINPLASAYGAPTNGTSDASAALSTACTAAATAGAPLLIDIKYAVLTTTTFNCDMTFGRGGAFAFPNPGIVATINGSIQADALQQIFLNVLPAVNAAANATSGSPTLTNVNITSGYGAGALATGSFVPVGATVSSVGSGTVTLSANLTGSIGSPWSISYSFQPVNVVANAPWVSIGWWGGWAAEQAHTDAMPAFRLAGGSNRTIYVPPGNYSCQSLTASPYPAPFGIGFNVCVDWNGLNNIKIVADGATITPTSANTDGDEVAFRYVTNFDFGGLHFGAYSATFTGSISGTTLTYPLGTDISNGVAITGSGVTAGTYVNGNPTCTTSCTVSVSHSQTVGSETLTAGLPCCEPTGLNLVNVAHGVFHDLWWDGNWGGSTKQPAGIGAAWLSDVTLHDLHMPVMALCADSSYLQHVRFFNIWVTGAPDNGDPASAPSAINCLALERDSLFIGYWPSLATAAGYNTTRDVTFGPGLQATNFAAGVFLRAGSHIRILGDDLSSNPNQGGGGAAHALGAGVYALYDTLGGVYSYPDPVTDVTINGNTFAQNGSAGSANAGACGSSTAPGGGVMLDASCVGNNATGSDATRSAAASGNTLNFNALSLPGWVHDAVANSATVTVADSTTPSAIPGGTHVNSIDLFNGVVVMSANVSGGGVGNGDTITFTTSAYATPSGSAISNVAVNGNVLDNNNSTGIESLGSSLSGISIGVNTYQGSNQTTGVDDNTITYLGNAPSSQIGGSPQPFFNPSTALTQYGGSAALSTGENTVWSVATGSMQVSRLHVVTSQAPGTGHSYVVTLRAAAGNTSVTCTISNSSNTCSDNTHTALITAGEVYNMMIVADSSAAASPFVQWSARSISP